MVYGEEMVWAQEEFGVSHFRNILISPNKQYAALADHFHCIWPFGIGIVCLMSSDFSTLSLKWGLRSKDTLQRCNTDSKTQKRETYGGELTEWHGIFDLM